MEADLATKLSLLSEQYAYMLMMLQGTELSKESLKNLKWFLSVFCSDVSFGSSCVSLECVVEILKNESKISLFNIAPLTACCRSSELSSKAEVCRTVQEYEIQLKEFWSGMCLKDFCSSLQQKIKNVKGMTEVIMKLNETASSYVAAEVINKYSYKLFGVTSKALILSEIHKGCVCVTWYVSSSLVTTLREKVEQLSPEYLASKGVLKLVIGDDLRIIPNEGLLC